MQLIIKTLFYHAAMKRTLHLQKESISKTEAIEEEYRHA